MGIKKTRRFLLKLLLLDADIVISAHGLEIWEKLTEVAKVHLPSIVIRKELKHYFNKDNQRIPIDIQTQLKEGVVIEETAPVVQIFEILKKLDISTRTGLSEADIEALSIMTFTKKDLIFCTADKKIIRALTTLDLKEKSSSFENVLKKCGLGRKLPFSLSEKHFKSWLEQGALDFVTLGKRKK